MTYVAGTLEGAIGYLSPAFWELNICQCSLWDVNNCCYGDTYSKFHCSEFQVPLLQVPSSKFQSSQLQVPNSKFQVPSSHVPSSTGPCNHICLQLTHSGRQTGNRFRVPLWTMLTRCTTSSGPHSPGHYPSLAEEIHEPPVARYACREGGIRCLAPLV